MRSWLVGPIMLIIALLILAFFGDGALFGEANSVHPAGIALMVTGLLIYLFTRLAPGKIPEEKRGRLLPVLQIMSLVAVAIGTLIAMFA